MQDRNNNMGILHLLGACFVMYGHQCALIGYGVPVILGTAMHAMGVKIIFLISGYLITKSLYKQTDNKIKTMLIYGVKRIGRIWPELIVCLLVTSFVIGPFFTNLPVNEYFANPMLGRYIISNILLIITYGLPGLFANNPYPNAVNGSLWTIPVEIALYILILIIYVVAKNNERRKCLFAFISIVMVLLFLFRLHFFPDASIVVYGTDWVQALNVAPYFMIGGCAYLYDVKRLFNVQVASVLLFVFCGVFFQLQVMNEAVCLIVLSYFILAISLSDTQGLKLKWLHSEYAYGMYLYGFVVQQCLVQKIYVERNRGGGILLQERAVFYLMSLIITYFIAMLSYKFVYMQINRVIKDIILKIEKKL